MKKNDTILVTSALSILVLSGSVAYAMDGTTRKYVLNEFQPAEIVNGIVEDTKSTETVVSKDYTLTTAKGGSTLSVYKPVQVLNVDATNQTSADAFIRVAIVPMWVSNNDGTSSSFVVGAMGGIINDDDNERVLQTQVTEVTDAGGNTITSTYEVQSTYQSKNDNDYLDIASFLDFTDVTIDSATQQFTTGGITFTLDKSWSNYWFFNSKDGYFYYKYVVPVGKKTQPLLESVSIDSADYYRCGDDGTPLTLQVDILSDSVQALGDAVTDVWTNVKLSKTSKSQNTKYKYELLQK